MTTTYMFNNETALSEISGKVLRLTTSASLGVLVTGVLLFLMCSLIAMNPPEMVETTHEKFDIWVDPNRDIEPVIKEKVIKPPEPTTEPDAPEIQENFENTETIQLVMAPPIAGPTALNIQSGMDSGSAMPIFRVAPSYPRRQQSRGIEGFVDLAFDIGPTGKTENIRVIYAEPKGAFERASIKALSKWKYQPAMEDGVGQVQKNQTTRIKFELEK